MVLLIVLSLVQFTNVLDFLIMMPLGPQYIRVFKISPAQFGYLVSIYATSAGIAGIAASFTLDRYDRKRALVLLYLGFVASTLLCAVATNYEFLATARMIAGAFGGVSGATILAIIGDVIPESRRGAAMGMVMSAFSVASIVGVPIGMYLANKFGWHAPFFMLTGFSLLVWIAAIKILPSMRSHIHAGPSRNSWDQFIEIIFHKNHLKAFLLMALMTAAGFCIFPYISPFMVHNVGLTEEQLPLIYFCGGLFTVFSMNIIGRLSDRAGKLRMFTIMSTLSFIPVLILTRLHPVPLAAALAVTTALMVCMSGRFVPAMALITSSVEREHRGAFMSINSSVQQFSSGIASILSGAILSVNADGRLIHFGRIGALSITMAATAILIARHVRPVKPATLDPILPAVGVID